MTSILKNYSSLSRDVLNFQNCPHFNKSTHFPWMSMISPKSLYFQKKVQTLRSCPNFSKNLSTFQKVCIWKKVSLSKLPSLSGEVVAFHTGLHLPHGSLTFQNVSNLPNLPTSKIARVSKVFIFKKEKKSRLS